MTDDQIPPLRNVMFEDFQVFIKVWLFWVTLWIVIWHQKLKYVVYTIGFHLVSCLCINWKPMETKWQHWINIKMKRNIMVRSDCSPWINWNQTVYFLMNFKFESIFLSLNWKTCQIFKIIFSFLHFLIYFSYS